MCKICNKIIKNLPNIHSWSLLGAPWGPFWQLLGTKMRPKGAQEHPEDANMGQLGSTWLQLGGPEPPKSFPNAAQDPFQIHFYNKFGAFVAPFSICTDFHLIL